MRRSAPAPWLARMLFAAACVLSAMIWLPELHPRYRPIAGVMVVLVGLAVEQILGRVRPERVAGSLAGLFVGAGAGAALLVLVPSGGAARSVGPFLVVLLAFLGSVSGGRAGDALARGAHPASRAGRSSAVVLDTSAIIDGRIVDITETGFLQGRVVVPTFVLRELQSIADSQDPQRRERGRRGLDALDRIKARGERRLEFPEIDPGGDSVDEKLVLCASALGAALVTMDDNLNRIAELRGVDVLSVNRLALALRPSFVPGERRTLEILREGREQDQGIAYLEDGSMVIVEGGLAHLGHAVDVEITSTLQRPSGRMYFARPAQDGPGHTDDPQNG